MTFRNKFVKGTLAYLRNTVVSLSEGQKFQWEPCRWDWIDLHARGNRWRHAICPWPSLYLWTAYPDSTHLLIPRQFYILFFFVWHKEVLISWLTSSWTRLTPRDKRDYTASHCLAATIHQCQPLGLLLFHDTGQQKYGIINLPDPKWG